MFQDFLPRAFNNCPLSTMTYEVTAGDSVWELRKDTILRYVPGVLDYPVKARRRFEMRPRGTIDISGIVTGNVYVREHVIPAGLYMRCLKELMGSIGEAQAHRTPPLLAVLENAWARNRVIPTDSLPYLFCFADLVQKRNLNGSPELQADLSTFFIRHAETLCTLPLRKVLQVVDMCPDPDFPVCMEHLLAKLPSHARHELEERRGRVRLQFTDKSSDKIKSYLQRRGLRRAETPAHPMMRPPSRNAVAISPRRRNADHHGNPLGRAERSISVERLLEEDIDVFDLARRGGRVIIPDRGRRGPGRGHHGRLFRFQ
ncbi:hypothetical protein FQN54_005244 [Arachnomyces sp. PD_36]|nr:hypothetical protein FQN54_005244 [Arachnomyces sp. PD_36]